MCVREKVAAALDHPEQFLDGAEEGKVALQLRDGGSTAGGLVGDGDDAGGLWIRDTESGEPDDDGAQGPLHAGGE